MSETAPPPSKINLRPTSITGPAKPAENGENKNGAAANPNAANAPVPELAEEKDTTPAAATPPATPRISKLAPAVRPTTDATPLALEGQTSPSVDETVQALLEGARNNPDALPANSGATFLKQQQATIDKIKTEFGTDAKNVEAGTVSYKITLACDYEADKKRIMGHLARIGLTPKTIQHVKLTSEYATWTFPAEGLKEAIKAQGWAPNTIDDPERLTEFVRNKISTLNIMSAHKPAAAPEKRKGFFSFGKKPAAEDEKLPAPAAPKLEPREGLGKAEIKRNNDGTFTITHIDMGTSRAELFRSAYDYEQAEEDGKFKKGVGGNQIISIPFPVLEPTQSKTKA